MSESKNRSEEPNAPPFHLGTNSMPSCVGGMRSTPGSSLGSAKS